MSRLEKLIAELCPDEVAFILLGSVHISASTIRAK